MKVTRMPPAYSANLVANSGNTIYGVSVIDHWSLGANWHTNVSDSTHNGV